MTFEAFSDDCWCNENGQCAFWTHKDSDCNAPDCPRSDDFLLFLERNAHESHMDAKEHQKREEGIE